MIKSFNLKKSSIHGVGIFTNQDIKKNAIFYTVPTDCILNKPKSKCAYIGKNKWISDENVLNHINHSCDPNSILDISNEPKLITKKDIKIGTEITVDYNKTEKKGNKVLCTCKSKNCKKYFLKIEDNTKPKIGILGGIGPESSAKFYDLLIKKAQSLKIKSNTEYPHIILESIPAPELLLDSYDLTMYKEAIKNLQNAGADFIVIVCNTAYTFLDEFKKLVNIPIIDLNEETKNILKQNDMKSITIFGSKKTIDKLFHFHDISVNKLSTTDSKLIEKIILEYNRGNNKEYLGKQLINIIKKYPQKNILIACTELSSILKNKGLKYLDTFDILLDATFQKWEANKLA